jgi:hypothetical protein
VVGIPSFPARDAIIFRAELRDCCGDSGRGNRFMMWH